MTRWARSSPRTPVPDAQDLAAARQQTRTVVADAAARVALRAWRRLDLADILTSWTALAAALLPAVAAAQAEAAAGADDYITRSLAAQNMRARDAGQIAAETFSGSASDGRPLLGLLASPAYTTLTAIGEGYPPARAAVAGGYALAAVVLTQVNDAGRIADQVAVVTHSRVGYVRMASPPCCARCAILAGKWFKWNAGFARHPRCNCVHIPAAEDRTADVRTDPQALFERGQIRGLSAADTKAVRAGADLNQVVNAHRGMFVAGGRQFTHEGVTVRGVAGQRLAAAGLRVRLTPEQIYREAGEDRAEAVRLLRRFGYLLD